MKTEKEALAFLDQTDADLSAAAVESTAEIEATQRAVAAHESAVSHYRTTGGDGLLPYLTAQSFFRELTSEVFGSTRPIGKSGTDEFKHFFDGRAEHLSKQAKAKYLRVHAKESAAALEMIYSARTKNREKWRQGQADAILLLEKKRILTSLDRTEGAAVQGQIADIENRLIASDSFVQECARWIARLRSNHASDDIVQVYFDACSFARQLQNFAA